MTRHPLRRLVAILVAVAFFGASMVQVTSAIAMPAGADMAGMAGMTMAADGSGADSRPMPCKSMTPACMIDLGCIFMIGVPAPPATPLRVHMAWARVAYPWPSGALADESNRAPDLRPPIRLI
jgi:hypothetical protein